MSGRINSKLAAGDFTPKDMINLFHGNARGLDIAAVESQISMEIRCPTVLYPQSN